MPKGDALVELDEGERARFSELLNGFAMWVNRGAGVLTFRGEKNAKLADRMVPRKEEDRGMGKVFSRLFVVGEKGEHFVRRDGGKRMLNLHDDSTEVFSFIAKQLANLMMKPDKFINFARRIFRNHNAEFRVLLEEDGQGDFCRRCRNASSTDRRLLRDYYLYFLHTVGNDAIKPISYFVSTSRDIRIAEMFAKGGDKASSSVILFYWVGRQIAPHGFDRQIAYRVSDIARGLGLPAYGDDLYPFQQEISIRAALFPHFLLGAYDLASGGFIVNPHALQGGRPFDANFFATGFEVDFRRFDDEIRNTDYHRYALRYSDRYEEIEVHHPGR